MRMEYKITKEELGNDWLYSTLVALNKCMAEHGLPLYVVGARARDVAMKLMKGDEPKRRTEDLDVAIAIEDWQTFDDICKTLENNHFKRHGETQKFFYKGVNGDLDFEVDIVPFGGVAVDEKIGKVLSRRDERSGHRDCEWRNRSKDGSAMRSVPD